MMPRSKWMVFGSQLSHTVHDTSTQVPAPVVSSADSKKFGLENFGNTCYANSVLQALYFCTPFRELMIQAIDHSLSQEPPPPPPPTAPTESVPNKPPPSLVPVRRKPERKMSTSGQSIEATPPPSAIPIPPSPSTLFSALRSLYVHISSHPGEKGTISPRAFIEKLKEINELFRSSMHQDAHEFLNFLLNKIVEEMEEERKQLHNAAAGEDLSSSIATLSTPPTIVTASSNSGVSPQDATLVHKLFEGVLTSETRCLTCETVSSRDESFLDLSIDIDQNSSVTACLRQFSASEMLCQKNKFFCDSCCDLQEAEKRMKIKRLPNVLALHLKRFKYQEDVQKYIKLAYRVAFPNELRLFNTVDDMENADRLYNLFAIVVHIGNGPHHGHYIAIIKTNGTWFVFDDDNVYSISESDIPKYFGDSNSGSAYVLYYQAVDIDLGALGLRPPVSSQSPPKLNGNSLPRSASPTHQNHITPSLPPGLTSADDDSSNRSESPIPVTPSPVLSPHPSSAPNRGGLSPIKVEGLGEPAIPLPNGVFAPSVSPMSPTKKPSKRGILGLARAPSLSASHSTGSTQPPNPAGGHKPAVPDLPSVSSPALLSDNKAVDMPPPPTLKQQPLHASGSSEDKKSKKELAAKAGIFWNRKSFRLGDKSKTIDNPILDILHSTQDAKADDSHPPLSSSHWFRSSTSMPKKDASHRPPSDTGLFTDPVFATISSATQRPKPNTRMLNNGKIRHQHSPNEHEDSSTSVSATSSVGSMSAGNSKPSVPSRPPSSTSPATNKRILHSPPPRNSSLAPIPRPQHHRTSSSEIRQREFPVPQSRHRPSTANAALSTSPGKSKRPLPPVPGSPATRNEQLNTPTILDAQSPLVTEPEDISGINSGPGDKWSFEGSASSPTRATIFPPSSLAMSVGTNRSTGSSSSNPNPVKRATRKLSMTSPFGFVRRDKEKEKERGREKERYS